MLKMVFVDLYHKINFIKEYFLFRNKSSAKPRFKIEWSDRYPILNEKTAGVSFDRHYVYHTAWAARKLREIKPETHVDISSSLFFCAIVSAFIPFEYYDYREVNLGLSGLKSGQADLLHLPFETNSIKSLSCLHVVEHVGLGRYGDKIDPDGDLRAIRELIRVLAPGGNLLFVVPVGKPKIMFNAHRIYSRNQIIAYYKKLELKEFTLIPEKQGDKGLVVNASSEMVEKMTYGCGCFWFKKPLSK